MAEITLTIPDELLEVYTRFQGRNGPQWAAAYVTEKLNELAQRKLKLEKDELHGDFGKLNAADRAAVQALLEKGKK